MSNSGCLDRPCESQSPVCTLGLVSWGPSTWGPGAGKGGELFVDPLLGGMFADPLLGGLFADPPLGGMFAAYSVSPEPDPRSCWRCPERGSLP